MKRKILPDKAIYSAQVPWISYLHVSENVASPRVNKLHMIAFLNIHVPNPCSVT